MMLLASKTTGRKLARLHLEASICYMIMNIFMINASMKCILHNNTDPLLCAGHSFSSDPVLFPGHGMHIKLGNPTRTSTMFECNGLSLLA